MSVNEKKLPKLILEFDYSVRQKNYPLAVQHCLQILGILEHGQEGFGSNLLDVTVVSETEATLVASAITTLLCDDDYVLNKKTLYAFGQYKRAISQVFEISGYRGTAHFINRFGTRLPDGKVSLKGTQIPKLFCALSINAMNKQMVDLFLRQDPNITWPLLLGFLSEQLLWHPDAEAARSQLFNNAHIWKDVPGTLINACNVGPAYMGCSYADAANKHSIKETINAVVRRWLRSLDIQDVPLPQEYRGVKKRPTLIVAAELYNSTHAMHRCYGPAIRALKGRFKLIYMSPDGRCDPKLHYMFDKIDETPLNRNNPKPFFDKMKSYRPDVVYYPSVGMRLLSILGSNLRIAPVQLMTYGHPATTYSDCIDYSLIVDGLIGSENTIVDKILYWYEASRYEIRRDAKYPEVHVRENLDTVRIAVPAWSRKVTPLFLETCKEIATRSTKPVKFYFFPNGIGALYQACKRRIGDMLNAEVLPRTDYNSYLNQLTQCDIFLSTFPFGATNGILDAGPLGLPIVNLKGIEMHAMNDSEMVSHMKQPDWLSCDTVNEYINAVLRLIKNDEERIAISKANAAFDYNQGMMVAADKDCPSFGIAVEAAYRFHNQMLKSGQKSFSRQSLKDMLSS